MVTSFKTLQSNLVKQTVPTYLCKESHKRFLALFNHRKEQVMK